MRRWAVISPDRLYRMQLGRCIDSWQPGMSFIAWVLNNPSTADEEQDDPTVRRLWQYTLDWRYAAMVVVNTNPFRSTDPKLATVPPEHVLSTNDAWLVNAIAYAAKVICGWGDKAHKDLAQRAVNTMHPLGPIYSMRVTKAGNPQHPLYLPGDLEPQLWNPTRWLH
jgi:hypothetical protein